MWPWRVKMPTQNLLRLFDTAADVDDEDRVGNSLLQIRKLRFGHKVKLFFRLWAQVLVKIFHSRPGIVENSSFQIMAISAPVHLSLSMVLPKIAQSCKFKRCYWTNSRGDFTSQPFCYLISSLRCRELISAHHTIHVVTIPKLKGNICHWKLLCAICRHSVPQSRLNKRSLTMPPDCKKAFLEKELSKTIPFNPLVQIFQSIYLNKLLENK